jgi:hypothetical protein
LNNLENPNDSMKISENDIHLALEKTGKLPERSLRQ